MKKQRFKITTEVYKELEIIAKGLAPAQRTQKDKTPMFRDATRLITGKDTTPEQRKQIKDFDLDKSYIQRYKEPVMVNHFVELTL